MPLFLVLALAFFFERFRRMPPLPSSFFSGSASPFASFASFMISFTSFDSPPSAAVAPKPASSSPFFSSSSSESLSSPSTMIPTGVAPAAPSALVPPTPACSSCFTLSFTLGGRRRAVVGRIDRFGSAPMSSPPAAAAPLAASPPVNFSSSSLAPVCGAAAMDAAGVASSFAGAAAGAASSFAGAVSAAGAGLGAGAAPPPERTVWTASVESGAFLAATASSCSRRFVFSGSRPATTLAGLVSTSVLSTTPTNLMIFSRYAILAPFSFMPLPSSSSPSYRPAAKPVASVTADTTSCTNRKGGFVSSFSFIAGFEMSAPINSWVTAMSPVHCSIIESKPPSIPIAPPAASIPPDLGAPASSFVWRPPPLDAGGLPASSLAGAGSSAPFSSAFSSAAGGAVGLSSSPPFASAPGSSPAMARATQSADFPASTEVAAAASCCNHLLVFSGSRPATTFPALMAVATPVYSPTHRMIRSRYSSFAPLSLISFPFCRSGRSSYSPAAKPVASVTAETMSWMKRNGGFVRSLSLSDGLAKSGWSTRWVSATSSSRDMARHRTRGH
mmetsp:Transcript_19979/g.36156  ORF Transcript_19979/g.36156 Transcript_19979/m.36156 type:complete len:558 (-) Transcript_19979:43-1716(-)